MTVWGAICHDNTKTIISDSNQKKVGNLIILCCAIYKCTIQVRVREGGRERRGGERGDR